MNNILDIYALDYECDENFRLELRRIRSTKKQKTFAVSPVSEKCTFYLQWKFYKKTTGLGNNQRFSKIFKIVASKTLYLREII